MTRGPTLDDSYVVTRADGAVRFLPDHRKGPGKAARQATVAGCALGLVLAVLWAGTGLGGRLILGRGPFFWDALVWPGGLFLLLLVPLVAGLARLVRERNRPLVAAPSGLLRHGPRQLVAPGAALSVRLERGRQRVNPEDGPSYDVDTAHIYVETADGRFVELPRPFFSQLDGWEVGRLLSDELALALGVPMSNEPPPHAYSTPGRRRRRERGCQGILALVVGLPNFLLGAGLLANGSAAFPGGWRWGAPAAFLLGGAFFGGVGWRLLGGRIRPYFLLLAGLAGLLGSVLALRGR